MSAIFGKLLLFLILRAFFILRVKVISEHNALPKGLLSRKYMDVSESMVRAIILT